MRTRFFLTLLSVSFLPQLISLSACSRQSEGERCSMLNGDADCDGSLVCTNGATLRNYDPAEPVDRCCPEDRFSYTDSRCAPRTATAGDGDGDGNGMGGAQSGGAGGGGGDTSRDDLNYGDACDWTSQCTAPLVCGPGAVCQQQCLNSRDCEEGETCNEAFTCVAE